MRTDGKRGLVSLSRSSRGVTHFEKDFCEATKYLIYSVVASPRTLLLAVGKGFNGLEHFPTHCIYCI